MPATARKPVVPVESFQDLSFPLAGIDLSMGFSKQMPRPMQNGQYAKTTPVGQNVRAYEPGTGRARGGSRPGLLRYITGQVNGSNSIQELTYTVMTTGTPPGGSSLGVNTTTAFNRGVVLVAVAGGAVRTSYLGGAWHTPATVTGTLSSTVPVIRSTVFGGKVYFADNNNYTLYNPSTDSVIPWTASTGTLPVGGSGGMPRLICTWRGRCALSGLPDDAQNVFFSAVGDFTNWNYSPVSVTPTQALALSTGPQGVVLDIVTGLIPYNDDILFILGANSLYQMSGDPMENGHLDRISDTIGGAFGNAWCRDPYGGVYFLSNRMGLYTMSPGQQPVRVSQQIEQLLAKINVDKILCRMIWDDALQGLHVFITHFASAQAETHFFWEQRSGAWWTDVFTVNNHNPLCCVAFEGNTPNDRVALIGSWDGYVRSFDPNTNTDDLNPISSNVFLGPILTPDFDDVMLKDIQGVMATGSGNVTYGVLTGRTAEEAASATPFPTGVWGPNRSYTVPIRRAGHAIYVQLSSSNYWAMEAVRARIAGLGKVRRRGGN